MNRESCPEPFARDELIIFNANSSCDANVVAYAVWLGILTFLKVITAIGITIAWFKTKPRNNSRLPSARRRRRRWFPTVPVFICTLAALFVIFLTLTVTNQCNSQNGCSVAIYSTMYFLYAGYGLVLQNHFISLGKRMIPLARTKLNEDFLKSSSQDSGEANHMVGINGDLLSKMDNVLRFLFSSQLLFLLLSWLFGTPIQLLSPRSNYSTWVSATLGMHAGCFITAMLTFLAQLQRLIVATKVGCAKPYNADVKRALVKMRKIQVVFTLLFVGSSSMSLAGAINANVMTWWYLLLLMSLEAAGTTFSFIAFTLNRLRRNHRPRTRGQQPRDENQEEATAIDGENTTSNNNSSYSKNPAIITPSVVE